MRSPIDKVKALPRALGGIYRGCEERLKREPLRVGGELAAGLALALAFGAFLVAWWHQYAPALTDPNLQTDDARTALFAFHRYAKGAPLLHDPIANEMIEYQPYAFRLIYRIAVPLVGLLYASKIAQVLCLAIAFAGGFVLAKSKRAGLGTGALFVFLFLRDSFIMDRVGGGLPRSFGFPVIALWIAGALAHSARARRAGAVLAALTYPSALAMVLGAEGVYTLRRFGRPGFATTLRRLKSYAFLVLACSLLFAPAALFATSGGPVHSMAQAEQEPAFSKSGRLWLLPLPEPGSTFGKQLFSVFRPLGDSPLPKFQTLLDDHRNEAAVVFVALLVAIPFIGVTATPAAAIAFLAGSLVMYAVSVIFAFRLYSPERYYSFGMHATALALVSSVCGQLLPRLGARLRAPLRNALGALFIFLLWGWLGHGAPSHSAMAMTIDYRHRAPLWEFIHGLPQDTRVASFIMDGDDIPLFSQRANNGGFETLQPWLTLSWARQKQRAEDTISAFYATHREEVLDYAKRYDVSHLLVNRSRYHGDVVKRALTFEPLSSFTRQLLARRNRDEFVLADLPRSAVIYEYDSLALVDVKKLAAAWAAPR